MKKLVCTICDRVYYFSSNKKIGHTLTKCNSCAVNKSRGNLKKKVNLVKLSRGCSICGYSTNPSALQFHHRNPDEKEFEISSSMCRQWNKIQAEIDKCDVLCANCHIELHNPL